jgi:P27 family predicted phage terminase small subunit
MGRTPLPPYLKVLRGNPGRRQVKPGIEPAPSAEPPEPPPFLDPDAQTEWRRLAPELTGLGVLTALDLGPFGAYCQLLSMWKTAVGELDRAAAADPQNKGLVIEGDKAMVMSPLVRIVSKCTAEMLAAAREFGLTPASRSRMSGGLGPPPEGGKFTGLLA